MWARVLHQHNVVLHLAIPCFLLEQSDHLSIFIWNRKLTNQVLTAEQTNLSIHEPTLLTI